jgi:hypothetical protein
MYLVQKQVCIGSLISLKKVCMDAWEPRVIWPCDHISAIWPYGHIAIWPYGHMAYGLKYVSTETSIKMQHSGKGIKLIGPS